MTETGSSVVEMEEVAAVHRSLPDLGDYGWLMVVEAEDVLRKDRCWNVAAGTAAAGSGRLVRWDVDEVAEDAASESADKGREAENMLAIVDVTAVEVMTPKIAVAVGEPGWGFVAVSSVDSSCVVQVLRERTGEKFGIAAAAEVAIVAVGCR